MDPFIAIISWINTREPSYKPDFCAIKETKAKCFPVS